MFYSHHLVVSGRRRVCSAGIGRAGRAATGAWAARARSAWARMWSGASRREAVRAGWTRRARSSLGSSPRRLLGSLLVLTCPLPVPTPDRPVVRSTVFLALEMETWDPPKDFQPDCRVAADLDLRF